MKLVHWTGEGPPDLPPAKLAAFDQFAARLHDVLAEMVAHQTLIVLATAVEDGEAGKESTEDLGKLLVSLNRSEASSLLATMAAHRAIDFINDVGGPFEFAQKYKDETLPCPCGLDSCPASGKGVEETEAKSEE